MYDDVPMGDAMDGIEESPVRLMNENLTATGNSFRDENGVIRIFNPCQLDFNPSLKPVLYKKIESFIEEARYIPNIVNPDELAAIQRSFEASAQINYYAELIDGWRVANEQCEKWENEGVLLNQLQLTDPQEMFERDERMSYAFFMFETAKSNRELMTSKMALPPIAESEILESFITRENVLEKNRAEEYPEGWNDQTQRVRMDAME